MRKKKENVISIEKITQKGGMIADNPTKEGRANDIRLECPLFYMVVL